MPGTVIGVHCAVGDAVTAGAPLLTLEAMKMETVIRAPRDGAIAELVPDLKAAVLADDLLVVMA
jgi:pyruvate carboxylase